MILDVYEKGPSEGVIGVSGGGIFKSKSFFIDFKVFEVISSTHRQSGKEVNNNSVLASLNI